MRRFLECWRAVDISQGSVNSHLVNLHDLVDIKQRSKVLNYYCFVASPYW